MKQEDVNELISMNPSPEAKIQFETRKKEAIDDRDIFESCYVELFGGVTSVLKNIRDVDEYKCSEPEILNSCWAMWKKARS